MSSPGLPTLDQLRVLVAVVETGSFSGAARKLNRAQSVVSYTIANLEAQLGLPLFERGRRRPILTKAGEAVFADARRVTLLVEELRARAAGLQSGLEAELAIAVDVMYPTALLVGLLHAFAQTHPTVSLRLRIEALGGVAQLVDERACMLGISSQLSAGLQSLERRAVGAIALVAVAAPTHPLAHEPAPLGHAAVHDHTQLVLTDASGLTQGQDFGVLSPRTWRLGDLGAKHALLRAGLGWGNMPLHAVADDLAEGRLVRLALLEGSSRDYPLSLIHRIDTPPGPAACWLMGRIAAVASFPGVPLPGENAAPRLDGAERNSPGAVE
ncbi:MAG TPA: LysR family transcriptional regulator [Acetobacteraceae bacterium]|jgi:DNA-binding transcriptional LysR family regulator|nr:LysR family transcriptional regulator [Acetobacteraceae bacterium]